MKTLLFASFPLLLALACSGPQRAGSAPRSLAASDAPTAQASPTQYAECVIGNSDHRLDEADALALHYVRSSEDDYRPSLYIGWFVMADDVREAIGDRVDVMLGRNSKDAPWSVASTRECPPRPRRTGSAVTSGS